ncbi:MAG TPA: apolipoprotein N-acyltransferase [Steroidobacteraceae bacterium]|nr:apolipoprotein N-acyltransferase [Steroidobacteraceae bacterium]
MNLRAFVERRFVGSAAALVAGMLLALSYAPHEWWPLAIAAPALLIWLWDGASPRRAAVLGFWFNAGTFSVGTYWLYIAIKEIGHAPLALALFLMAGLVAIMGAYHALLGWTVAKFLPGRGALRWLVAIPGAWLLIEWFRSWFLSGFGWLALGYAHTDNWLGGLAPVVGQYGLGLLTLVMAGGLVALLLGNLRARIAVGALYVAIWGAAFALRGVEWTETYSRPITVAVVQGAIPQDEKWIGDNLESILEVYRKLTREAHGAALIVWPESAVPDLANNHIDYYRDVYAEASAHGSALMMGTLRAEENAQSGEEEVFNSILVMDKSTPGVGWYDKHHLVPFTEFVPVPGFVRQWLKLMTLPYSDFNRGAAVQPPLEAAGQRISASVCYEDAYGATQLPALRTATLLVNVTNDAWFGHSSARYQHLQISRMRAMEAGRPMVRAANDGVSAVIGSHGEFVKLAPEYEANVMRAEVQPRIGLTPYARTGNWLVVCLALVFCVAGAYVRRRARSA